jgi:hypothetical protein
VATLNLSIENSATVISDPEAIPSKPHYRRPDLRQVSLTRIGNRKTEGPLQESLSFSIPFGNQALSVSLTIELLRNGPTLRGVVRLRPGPLQLVIDFPPVQEQLSIEFP